MAYLAPTVDGVGYYNVNFAVGNGATNRRDDVFLVQWMLQHIYKDDPTFFAPESKPLAVDGWIGPQTIKWIRAFQSDVIRRGFALHPDGRVDSARKAVGAVSKLPYTILLMNAFFHQANPKVFLNPASDPGVPKELLKALATNNGDAGPFENPPIQVPSSGGI